MAIILEGIVTTLDENLTVNVSPMGAFVGSQMQSFVLRPYQTARTYRNLKRHPEGVFHVTDDVQTLARAAISTVRCETFPAEHVRGAVLRNTCRWYEFRVTNIDDVKPRALVQVEVVHRGWLRDVFGFNRAKHAVVEAAILATRTEFLPAAEILAEYRRLAVLVDKTGGPDEQQAFDLLQQHVEQYVREKGIRS